MSALSMWVIVGGMFRIGQKRNTLERSFCSYKYSSYSIILYSIFLGRHVLISSNISMKAKIEHYRWQGLPPRIPNKALEMILEHPKTSLGFSFVVSKWSHTHDRGNLAWFWGPRVGLKKVQIALEEWTSSFMGLAVSLANLEKFSLTFQVHAIKAHVHLGKKALGAPSQALP